MKLIWLMIFSYFLVGSFIGYLTNKALDQQCDMPIMIIFLLFWPLLALALILVVLCSVIDYLISKHD